MKLKDLSGKRFGKLVAIRIGDPKIQANGKRKVRWLCKCDCGNQTQVLTSLLNPEGTKSCGCLRVETNSTHGLRGNYLERLYRNMIQRCRSKKRHNSAQYSHVSVCERWLSSIENFIADIPARPSEAHSLDRIDGTKGYEPANVRWATRYEQANNMKNNVRIEMHGENLTLKQWERKLGVCASTFHNYAKKRGVSKEDAVREYCKRKNFPLGKQSEIDTPPPPV